MVVVRHRGIVGVVGVLAAFGCAEGAKYHPQDGGASSGDRGSGGESMGSGGLRGTGGGEMAANGSGGSSIAVGSGGTMASSGSGGTSVGTGGATTGTGGSGTGTGGLSGCGASEHLCSGTCVDSKSINTCGTQCDPCKAPTGAAAICDGSTCDFTCGATLKKCAVASICVSTTGCCADADCPMQAGGQAGTCDSGTHTCNYACAVNMKACTVSGTTTCLPSTGCCQDSDCAGNCQTCSATSHTCVAAVNKDDPNGRCAGTCDATGACRSKRGQTCSATAGGCLSGSICSPDGYCCDQACTASCLACDLPGKLGTCSPVTSGAPHGTRTACVGTNTICAGACGSRTDGACVYPTGNCGTGPMCDASGASDQGTCSAGACNVPMTVSCPNGCNTGSTACLSCAAGQMGCSGACKMLTTDVQNCGSCGYVCKAPTLSVSEPGAIFGAAACGGSCGWTCNSGFMKCPGTNPVCSRTSYDFEDGTTQGHYLRTDLGSDFGLTSVQNSTTKAHGGTHSLALTMRPGGGHINLFVYICDGGNAPLLSSSRTISAWFYVAATTLDETMSNYLQLGLWVATPAPSTFRITGGEVDTIALNTWTQIIAPVVTSAVSDVSPYLEGFVFDGFIHQPGAAIVYVDDIVWQ